MSLFKPSEPHRNPQKHSRFRLPSTEGRRLGAIPTSTVSFSVMEITSQNGGLILDPTHFFNPVTVEYDQNRSDLKRALLGPVLLFFRRHRGKKW